MKFKFKRTIEIETEFEAALLGYNVRDVFLKINKDKIKRLLIEAIENEIESQQIENFIITSKDNFNGIIDKK
jgi:hypothetical protein